MTMIGAFLFGLQTYSGSESLEEFVKSEIKSAVKETSKKENSEKDDVKLGFSAQEMIIATFLSSLANSTENSTYKDYFEKVPTSPPNC